MIRLIKRLADWLDTRFPEKFHVTSELYDKMQEREYQRGKAMTSMLHLLEEHKAKINSLDASMAALKDLLSKGAAVGMAKETRRADFIASGRMGE